MIDGSKTCKLLAGVDVSVRLLLKDVVIHLHRTPFYTYVVGFCLLSTSSSNRDINFPLEIM